MYSAALTDTLRTTETAIQEQHDSLDANHSTNQSHIPLPTHGRLFQLPFAEKVIDKHDIETVPYFELTDILYHKTSEIFPLSLGNYGQYNSFGIFGGSARDNTMRFNGREIISSAFGTFLFDQFPPEILERIEILTGSDAVIFGDNSSGMTINVQEAIHNTKSPYTRLWYAQGEYDYIASDGIYSQNFAPNWNGTFGFRRQSSSGHFANSGFDIWNVRLGLRYSPSNSACFTLTEIFTNHGFDANGGLAANSPSFTDQLAATSRITDLDERTYRHDITLAGSWKPDSSFAASSTLFYSQELWEINRGPQYFTSVFDTVRLAHWASSIIGATARAEQKITDALYLRAGTEATWTNSVATVYAQQIVGISIAGYSHAAWMPSDGISVRSGIRIRIDQDRTTLAIGGAASLQISAAIKLTADISQSDRAPSPTEGRNLSSEKQLLAIGGLHIATDATAAGLQLFSRFVSSPIESRRITDSNGNTLGTYSYAGTARTIAGGILYGKIRLLPQMLIHGWLQSYFSADSAQSGLPSLYAGITAQYEYSVGASSLIVGTTAAGMTARRGLTFVPQTWEYIPAETETPAAFNGFSIFASAKLGNARLRAIYSNLLSARIEYVPYYPALDRNLRLSLSWAFND